MTKIKLLFHAFILLSIPVISGVALAGPPDFRGNWAGTWTSTWDGSSGRIEAAFYQSGTSLSGTISIYGTDCAGHPNFLNLPLHEGASIVVDEASFRVSDYCQGDYVELSMTEINRSI